jgi:hypothetical protein
MWLEQFTTRARRKLRAAHYRVRFQLGLPQGLSVRARLSPQFNHPVDLRRRESIAALYSSLFPEAAATEIAEAKRLLEHRITLLGHTSTHGERIAWSRDPITGRDWPGGFSPDIVYRGPGRLGDIKLPWELNKHQYFFTLGKAAWLTGDSALALEVVRQIDQWIDDNPVFTGVNWISALEVGSRLVSWVLAYPFYAEYMDQRVRQRMVDSMVQHLLFIEAHLSEGNFANNHLVGEAAALVVGALFVECRHRERWLTKGLGVLERQAGRQVTGDGVHIEMSVAYHRYCMDQLFLAQLFLKAQGRSLSSDVLRVIERMAEFLMHVVRPDGSAVLFGDGDDARGLWTRADSPRDFRGLLALAAVSFQRPDFKAVARQLTEEVLWFLGPEGVASFDALAAKEPDVSSMGYREAGYYIMRGGWNAADAIMIVDCGPLGHGPAGHGHADALSFQLYANGYPYVVDSGTYSYNLDAGWRDAFRSTRAHNTVVVDHENQSVTADRMAWGHKARSHARLWASTPWFEIVDGEHDGYLRLADPVSHRRVVAFLKPDVWVVWDFLSSQERHHLEFLLHVLPDCRVETGGGVLVLEAPDGRRLTGRVVTDASTSPDIAVIAATESERGAWYSPSYGTRVPSRAVSVSREFSGHASFGACMTTSPLSLEVSAARSAGCVTVARADGDDALWCGPASSPETSFDGAFLFRRRERGRSLTAWATGFHNLVLEGELEVHSRTEVQRLVMSDGRVDLRLGTPDEVDIAVPEGVRVLINGQPRPDACKRIGAGVHA